MEDWSIDQAVLWFTLGASILAGILFGLAPAVLVSRQELTTVMKEGGAGAQTGAVSTRHKVLRQLLVIGEVALALLLVIGATLALRSLARLRSVNLGYRSDHLLTMRINFPPGNSPSPMKPSPMRARFSPKREAFRALKMPAHLLTRLFPASKVNPHSGPIRLRRIPPRRPRPIVPRPAIFKHSASRFLQAAILPMRTRAARPTFTS